MLGFPWVLKIIFFIFFFCTKAAQSQAESIRWEDMAAARSAGLISK